MNSVIKAKMRGDEPVEGDVADPGRMITHLAENFIVSALSPDSLARQILRVSQGRPSVPLRQRLDCADGRELLVMPVVLDRYAGVKTLTVVPDNVKTGRPVISGLFTLFDFMTGEPVATMDSSALTAVRTAAVSAAASSILSRADSYRVTMLGAGHLAPFLAAAHAAVRPIRKVTFWARRPSQAASAAERLRSIRPDLEVSVTENLENAVRSTDIVSTATRATAPVIRGAWLAPGTHLDLVGGYRPDMREIDDAGIVRSKLYVDSRMAALSEAGDIIDPLQRSVIDTSHIKGELADLATGAARRAFDEDITLFKSVGTAMADLAAAIGIWEAYDARRNRD